MKLCVALDLPSQKENLALIDRLQDFDIWYKVGLRSYIRDGSKFLDKIKDINSNNKIFLDLKLYDIPNTMADASFEIASMNVDMFNIHASSGSIAMQTVMDRINGFKSRPLVLGVTALTSFDNAHFRSIYAEDIDIKADFFAKQSFESGLDGVVCSAHESRAIKNSIQSGFLTLTPGIRPQGSDNGDQQRVMTPLQAKEEGIDFIVVGRPIYKDNTPEIVVEQILKDIV